MAINPDGAFLVMVIVSVAMSAALFATAGLLARVARRFAQRGRLAAEILATLGAAVCVGAGMLCLSPILIWMGLIGGS